MWIDFSIHSHSIQSKCVETPPSLGHIEIIFLALIEPIACHPHTRNVPFKTHSNSIANGFDGFFVRSQYERGRLYAYRLIFNAIYSHFDIAVFRSLLTTSPPSEVCTHFDWCGHSSGTPCSGLLFFKACGMHRSNYAHPLCIGITSMYATNHFNEQLLYGFAFVRANDGDALVLPSFSHNQLTFYCNDMGDNSKQQQQQK